MFKLIMFFLSLIGIILIVSGVSVKVVKSSLPNQKTRYNKNTFPGLLERVTEFKIIAVPLDFISKDKKSWANKYLCKLLELSEAGLSLKQAYFLKFLCLITCTGFLLAVSYSNMFYQTKILIESTDSESNMTEAFKSSITSKYKLYNQIHKKIDIDLLSLKKYEDQYAMVEEAVTECLSVSDKKIIEEKTEWFMDTWDKARRIKSVQREYLLFVLVFFFIPDVYFVLSWLIKGSVYKREIIKLEYVFELLAGVDGIKTPDIINQLEKSSRIYSKFFLEFSHLFKYDKNRAFKFLKSRNIKSLAKMSNILEIYSLTSKEIAMQVLEREVIERDEAIMMTADETVDFIDLVAFLSIVPLVYELARLMLNPMLDMVYKAFEYI